MYRDQEMILDPLELCGFELPAVGIETRLGCADH